MKVTPPWPTHSRFHTRRAANSTTALDKTFIVSATTLSKLAGLLTVGLTGHLTTTALGRSLPGSTNSMVSAWPLRLRWIAGLRYSWEIWLPFASGLDLLGPSVFAHWRAAHVVRRYHVGTLLMILVSYHLP